jgi:drug/metabolite transporter (DMT)-like permease
MDMAATAAALGALICWSLGPIFIEYLTAYLDSWTQNMIRYSVAALFWLPFLLYARARGRFDRSTWRRAIIPSLANVSMQTLWAVGFYYVGPAFLTLLMKTQILWVASFSLIVFPEERPLVRSVRFWLGFVLSAVGVVGVLYFKEDFHSPATLIGIVIGLMTAFVWGIYALSVRIAFRHIDSRIGFSVISLYTATALIVIALFFGRPAEIVELGLRPWTVIVISAITAIALGHTFFYTAVRRIGATIPTLVILAQPFVVFSLSQVIFHERMRPVQLLFGLILLVGAALSVWAQQHLRARRRPEEDKKNS